MLLLGVSNTGTQPVLTNGIINLGAVYRKYCKKCNGITTFTSNGNSISLNQSGVYHITALITFTGAVAGDAIINLIENGLVVASSTETITTAATEFRQIVLDFYSIVDSSCVLGSPTINAKNISLLNAGIGITAEDVVLNVEKVV